MIFATVGSTQFPFQRLVSALDDLPGEQLLAQHGPVSPPANAARSCAFMQFPEVIESMRQADVVISHAGAGSILCAVREGHTPVVVPRLKHYGEAVDDHQVEFAEALAETGNVIVVDDISRLASSVASAPPRTPVAKREGMLPIQSAVREALHAPLAVSGGIGGWVR